MMSSGQGSEIGLAGRDALTQGRHRSGIPPPGAGLGAGLRVGSAGHPASSMLAQSQQSQGRPSLPASPTSASSASTIRTATQARLASAVSRVGAMYTTRPSTFTGQRSTVSAIGQTAAAASHRRTRLRSRRESPKCTFGPAVANG